MPLPHNNEYYIDGLRSNDSASIAQLYDLLFPKVNHFINTNNGTRHDAEDIFQTVILQISARIKADRFQTEAPFDAYILQACKFQWFKEIKRRKKKDWVTNPLEDAVISRNEDLAKSTVDSERYDLFTKSISLLSGNCKIILQLFFENKSGKEIMEIMDYGSETTVRQRIFKCKKKLFSLIQSNELFQELKAK